MLSLIVFTEAFQIDKGDPCPRLASPASPFLSLDSLFLFTFSGHRVLIDSHSGSLFWINILFYYHNIFRISRSFDAIGSMARTPYDLSLLTESILTPEARAKLPENGYRNSFTESWEGLRVGILPSAWA